MRTGNVSRRRLWGIVGRGNHHHGPMFVIKEYQKAANPTIIKAYKNRSTLRMRELGTHDEQMDTRPAKAKIASTGHANMRLRTTQLTIQSLWVSR